VKKIDYNKAYAATDMEARLRPAFLHCLHTGFAEYGQSYEHASGACLTSILGTIAAWEEVRTKALAAMVRDLLVVVPSESQYEPNFDRDEKYQKPCDSCKYREGALDDPKNPDPDSPCLQCANFDG